MKIFWKKYPFFSIKNYIFHQKWLFLTKIRFWPKMWYENLDKPLLKVTKDRWPSIRRHFDKASNQGGNSSFSDSTSSLRTIFFSSPFPRNTSTLICSGFKFLANLKAKIYLIYWKTYTDRCLIIWFFISEAIFQLIHLQILFKVLRWTKRFLILKNRRYSFSRKHLNK